jgi:hypothetical protein
MRNPSIISRMRRGLFLLLATMLASVAAARADSLPTPSPTASAPATQQALSDAWWTGPMLAPSAATLPQGHILVEPYIFNVIQYGQFDRNGTLVPTTHSNDFGSLTYFIYGLANRFSVGLIPILGYNTVSGGPNADGIGIGDLGVLAQYRLTQYRLGHWMPTASLSVQETIPTGKYDDLGDNPSNGLGGGVYSTKVSLYTQTYAWMPNGRILRLRLNLSQTFSGSANIQGVSVYSTGSGFRGSVQPGNTTTIDAAGEYSITRNWVAASDLVFSYSGNTTVSGTGGVANLGDSHAFAFAPAIEYNWTANAGILFGVRFYPAGRNTAASITPAIAVNMVR